MNAPPTNLEAKAIARKVAEREHDRDLLRQWRDKSPILEGVMTPLIVFQAAWLWFGTGKPAAWVQIVVSVAAVWMLVYCGLQVHKYRQLRRAIDRILADTGTSRSD